MSDGYSYDDRPSKQEVREAAIRYRDAYGIDALKEFMGYLGFKRIPDIPGESYQYVIDCLDAELEDKGEDFVVPASPVPFTPPPPDDKEAKRRENRRRWAEERRRDEEQAYAMRSEPTLYRTPGWGDEATSERARWPGRKKVKVEAPEEPVEQKSWVEKRFGVLDV